MNHEKLKNSRDHGCEIIRVCFVVPPRKDIYSENFSITIVNACLAHCYC